MNFYHSAILIYFIPCHSSSLCIGDHTFHNDLRRWNQRHILFPRSKPPWGFASIHLCITHTLWQYKQVNEACKLLWDMHGDFNEFCNYVCYCTNWQTGVELCSQYINNMTHYELLVFKTVALLAVYKHITK